MCLTWWPGHLQRTLLYYLVSGWKSKRRNKYKLKDSISDGVNTRVCPGLVKVTTATPPSTTGVFNSQRSFTSSEDLWYCYTPAVTSCMCCESVGNGSTLEMDEPWSSLIWIVLGTSRSGVQVIWEGYAQIFTYILWYCPLFYPSQFPVSVCTRYSHQHAACLVMW